MEKTIKGKLPKVNFYKSVSLFRGVRGTPYNGFIKSINGIGATLNSVVKVNQDIANILTSGITLKSRQLQDEKERFNKEKAEKNKLKTDKKSSFLGILADTTSKVAGGFLAGLSQLGSALMKFVISQSILRWMANPENTKKLARIIEGLFKVFSFISSFLRDNIVKMLDGLATMLDGSKNFFERFGGFISFVTGFGSILLAATFLRRPGLLIKGVKFVLVTIANGIKNAIRALSNRRGIRPGAPVGSPSTTRTNTRLPEPSTVKPTARPSRMPGILGNIAAIGIPLVVGAALSGGESEFEKSAAPAPGPAPAPNVNLNVTPQQTSTDNAGGKPPYLAEGGIVTRPTTAILGERGPEIKIPLNIPSDNNQRRSDAGIKPLSSLFGNNLASPQADKNKVQSLSDLFMAPFKGIGAGILANISNIVSSMGPAGAAITPILGNIIAPIANSFGVPPSLVKSLTGKGTFSQNLKQDTREPKLGKSGKLEKLFGKGHTSKETTTQFQRKGDSSVLGLLSDLVSAAQIIGNKIGGSTTTTTTTSDSSGSSAPSITSSAAGAAKPELKPNSNVNIPKQKQTFGIPNVLQNLKDKAVNFATTSFGNIKNTASNMLSTATGWITGPQSGYPVSLDGGKTVAFEGHGTEWVGSKRSGGGAFVVPVDTPATRKDKNLTSRRIREAMSGGYLLPSLASGGRVNQNQRGSGDQGLRTSSSGGVVVTSNYGWRWGRPHNGVDLAGVPIGTPIKTLTGGKVLYASTYNGYGNTVDLQVSPNKMFRFAHLDGIAVRAGQQIPAGALIGTLGNTGVGTGPHLHFEHRQKQEFGVGTSTDPVRSGAINEISIGGKPITGLNPNNTASQEDPMSGGGTTPVPEVDPFQAFAESVNKLNSVMNFSPVPQKSLEQATKDSEQAKNDARDKKKKQTSQTAANAAAAAAATNKRNNTQTVASTPKPIILPAPNRMLPIEALNSTTSIAQYSWKFA